MTSLNPINDQKNKNSFQNFTKQLTLSPPQSKKRDFKSQLSDRVTLRVSLTDCLIEKELMCLFSRLITCPLRMSVNFFARRVLGSLLRCDALKNVPVFAFQMRVTQQDNSNNYEILQRIDVNAELNDALILSKDDDKTFTIVFDPKGLCVWLDIRVCYEPKFIEKHSDNVKVGAFYLHHTSLCAGNSHMLFSTHDVVAGETLMKHFTELPKEAVETYRLFHWHTENVRFMQTLMFGSTALAPSLSQRFHCTSSRQNISVSDTQYCGDCRAVAYCSKNCQQQDWVTQHRSYCQRPFEFIFSLYYNKRVELVGLKSENGKRMNGSVGIVKGFDATKQRFKVEFESVQKVTSVKEINLRFKY